MNFALALADILSAEGMSGKIRASRLDAVRIAAEHLDEFVDEHADGVPGGGVELGAAEWSALLQSKGVSKKQSQNIPHDDWTPRAREIAEGIAERLQPGYRPILEVTVDKIASSLSPGSYGLRTIRADGSGGQRQDILMALCLNGTDGNYCRLPIGGAMVHHPAGATMPLRISDELAKAAKTFQSGNDADSDPNDVTFFPRAADSRQALAVSPGAITNPSNRWIAELVLNDETFRTTKTIGLFSNGTQIAKDPERIKGLLLDSASAQKSLPAPDGCSITTYDGLLAMTDDDGLHSMQVAIGTNVETTTGFYVHNGLPDDALAETIALVLASPSRQDSCRRRANLACRRFAYRTPTSKPSPQVRAASHLAFGAIAYLHRFCSRHPETFDFTER